MCRTLDFFLEVKRFGYKNCLDSFRLRCQRLDFLFEYRRKWVFLLYVHYSCENYVHPFAIDALGFGSEEFLKIRPVTNIAIGLSFLHETSLILWDKGHKMVREKVSFLFFTCFEVVVHKLQLAHLAKRLPFAYSKALDT